MTFAEGLARCAPELTPKQVDQLHNHYFLLEKWNKVMNLSAIRDLPGIIERHYCESLFLARELALSPGTTVVDVGSGAGFPGVPLAVVYPECQVTLVESHARKSVFLREATRDIPNVSVLNSRIETVQLRFHRQRLPGSR